MVFINNVYYYYIIIAAGRLACDAQRSSGRQYNDLLMIFNNNTYYYIIIMITGRPACDRQRVPTDPAREGAASPRPAAQRRARERTGTTCEREDTTLAGETEYCMRAYP